MKPIVAWLVAVMVAHSSLKTGEGYKNPDAHETQEQRLERYEGMAEAIAKVAFDPAERPLYAGPRGRHQTATLLLGVAWYEGSWRRDVDLGLGKHARGGGTDSCNMQVRLAAWKDKDGSRVDGRTREGWDWHDLVADREKCFRAGLHIVRGSMGACRSLPPEHALAAYARGSCSSEEGQEKSKLRVDLGRRLLTMGGKLPERLPDASPEDGS